MGAGLLVSAGTAISITAATQEGKRHKCQCSLLRTHSSCCVPSVLLQMASLQGSNPGRVVSVPAAMVAECMECLEEIATADMQAS